MRWKCSRSKTAGSQQDQKLQTTQTNIKLKTPKTNRFPNPKISAAHPLGISQGSRRMTVRRSFSRITRSVSAAGEKAGPGPRLRARGDLKIFGVRNFGSPKNRFISMFTDVINQNLVDVKYKLCKQITRNRRKAKNLSWNSHVVWLFPLSTSNPEWRAHLCSAICGLRSRKFCLVSRLAAFLDKPCCRITRICSMKACWSCVLFLWDQFFALVRFYINITDHRYLMIIIHIVHILTVLYYSIWYYMNVHAFSIDLFLLVT